MCIKAVIQYMIEIAIGHFLHIIVIIIHIQMRFPFFDVCNIYLTHLGWHYNGYCAKIKSTWVPPEIVTGHNTGN